MYQNTPPFPSAPRPRSPHPYPSQLPVLVLVSDVPVLSVSSEPTPSIEDAIRLYPSLARVRELVTTGACPFRFAPYTGPTVREGALIGVRVWLDGTTDTMGILSQEQARVVRVVPHVGRVYELVDTLDRVLDAVEKQLVHPLNPASPRRPLPEVIAGYTAPSRR